MNIELNIFEIPVSVNNLYKRSKHGGLYLNEKVLAFRALVILELEKIDYKKTDKNVRVCIEFYVTKKNIDIDNLCKVVLDSLNKRVFNDDSQVYELFVKKIIGKEKKTFIKIIEV